MKLRVGTFNLENLFNRYALLDEPWENRSYEKLVAAFDVASIASRTGDLVSYETTQLQRNNTALAIEAARPDVLVVAEVENLVALRNFNHIYLDDYFDRQILIDGNDPRGIDVGVLIRAGAKVELAEVRTHVDETLPGPGGKPKPLVREARRGFGYFAQNVVFSRDCLEVDLRIGGVTLTLFANHLKAQDGGTSHVKRRRTQAERVAELVSAAVKRGSKPIVLGDLNVDTKAGDKSLDPLVKHKSLKDTNLNGDWTHYYASKKTVSRLDYVLVDNTFAAGPLEIVRNGLTTKCKQYTGPRFPTIGPEHTEASDHCAIVVELDL